jgi:hypothetical protein
MLVKNSTTSERQSGDGRPKRARTSAARKPAETVHPEFQGKFSRAFDEFIPIEVPEMRDRRNVAIHAAADKLLASYRDKIPEVVRRIQLLLDNPPYGLPPGGGAGSLPSPPPVAKP